MAEKTEISWTDSSWNPVTGCSEVSPGCDHCYAKTFAERFRGTPGHHFEQGFDVVLRPERLDQPIRWKKSRRIFVNSMSDLFHDEVHDDYIAQVFGVMALAPQHTFQLLTKRHGRMRSLLRSAVFESAVYRAVNDMLDAGYPWPDDWEPVGEPPTWPLPNVWVGVSVENQQWADIRIPALLDTPAAIRFLSCEPLLGPVDLVPPLKHWAAGRAVQINETLHWIIAGGESGKGARPMHPDWACSLRDQCTAAGVAFHFKQWGEWVPEDQMPEDAVVPARFFRDDDTGGIRLGKGNAGRDLDGRTWDEFPQTAVSA